MSPDDEHERLVRWGSEHGRRFRRWLDGGKHTDPDDDVDVDAPVPPEVYFQRADEIATAPGPDLETDADTEARPP